MKINAFEFIPITFVLNTLDVSFEWQQGQFLNFYYKLTPPLGNTKLKTSLQIVKKSLVSASLLMEKKMHTVHSKYEVHGAFDNPSTKALWILKPTFLNRVHVPLDRVTVCMSLLILCSWKI
jgi:hypothetical protein